MDYGNLDFRFKNPQDTPVYIAAWMSGTTLYVEFYGCFPQEWDSVGRFQRADQRLGPPGLGELPHRQQPGQRPVCAALLRQTPATPPGRTAASTRATPW